MKMADISFLPVCTNCKKVIWKVIIDYRDDYIEVGYPKIAEITPCCCPNCGSVFTGIKHYLHEEIWESERLKMEERDIAKEPEQYEEVRFGMGYEYYDWRCPTCKRFVAYEPDIDGIPKRCINCGQLLKKPLRRNN